jgi:hypothetical protein
VGTLKNFLVGGEGNFLRGNGGSAASCGGGK